MSGDYDKPRVDTPGSTPVPDWARAGVYRLVGPDGEILSKHVRGPLGMMIEDVERAYPGVAYTVEEMWLVEAFEWRVSETPADRDEALTYAFGHLVSSYSPAPRGHEGDSADLAQGVLTGDMLRLDPRALAAVHRLAEYVAGNYEYTGEAEAALRRVRSGED